MAGKEKTEQEEAKKKKDERKIEDETFQEILGNSSLLKKITQYGEENLPEFSRRPLNGQMVTIAYEAYLKDSLKLVDHNDNLSFILGDGDVISGNYFILLFFLKYLGLNLLTLFFLNYSH